MFQRKSSDYTIKRIMKTKYYLVVFFQTPHLGTWSVFIPKSEIEDFKMIEKAVKDKIEELEHELKAREKKWKVPIKRIMGLTLYKTDVKVLLSLSLEGPCKSVYELWQKRKVVAKSTSYATIERLQSYRLVKRILTEGRRKYAITLLGFCAMIWEGIEQILEKRDEIITKNPHILPTIFNHWSTFKEDLRNEIWGRILEYVHSEFEARLLLFQNKYSLMELENVEKILEYDLTRFIVFPWIHEFIDKLLFLYCREELDVDQAPDEEVRKAVESFKKFIEESKREHIKRWLITLSSFDFIRKFMIDELTRLEKLFCQFAKILKQCTI